MDALFCAPDSPRPELLGVQQASTGWVNKYLLSYQLPDGTPFTYESASRERSAAAYEAALRRYGQGEPVASEAVCVVPMLPDGELMLIKEFRYPVNSWVVAFPAGLIDEGEDEVTAISRELAEEVGLRVRTELGQRAVRMLPQAGLSSTGLTEEAVRIAVVQVDHAGQAQPEPNELIEPFTLRREDIGAFLERNQLPIGTRAQLMLMVLAADDSLWA